MTDLLISVIVPIYNVEKYLDRCIESIVNQTYKNLEIILVDDGSPDNCPAMCDDWAKKDNRIKVIHKENGGLSDARNAGLDVFKGDWVLFVDSDDTIEADMAGDLLLAAITNNTQIAMCGMNICYEDGSSRPYVVSLKSEVISSELYLEHLYDCRGCFVVACNKIYNRSLFDTYRFKKGILFEDAEVIYRIVHEAKAVSVLKKAYYNYFQISNSISRSSFNVKKLSIVDTMLEQKKFFLEHDLKTAYKNLLETLIYRIRAAAICSVIYCNNKADFSHYYKLFRKALFDVVTMKASIGRRELVRDFIFLIFPHTFIYVTKDKYTDL